MHRAGLAGFLIALVLAAPAAATTVRIEGENATLLARTPVNLPSGTEPNTGCPGDSASAAIEVATHGNWDRQPFTQTILGETHDFSHSDFWNFWVFRGGRYVVANGICDERLAGNEELLGAYQIAGDSFEPTIFPLWLSDVPARVVSGNPFTVTVNRAACETDFCNPGEGHRVAAVAATVKAGEASAVSGNDGKATLTLTTQGATQLQATGGGLRSATETVTVDPPYTVPTQSPTPTPDTTAPVSKILRLRDRQVFKKRKRKRVPRFLRARVTEAGGLAAVELGITRRVRKRCTAYDDTLGGFKRVRCGSHPRFVVGTAKRISFLLPTRPGRGRYTFDVRATDVAGNAERLARGRNRVVFFVR
jgi:hypothetical protein